MSAALLDATQPDSATSTATATLTHADAACASIAPAWPLDRLIAVNPWWSFVGQPIADAGAELSGRSGTRMVMPRAWYRAQWEAGRFTADHLARAIASERPAPAVATSVNEIVGALHRDAPASSAHAHRQLMTDVIDAGRDISHEMAWREYVIRQLSQSCAACFDEGQSRWMPDRSGGLYPLWRELTATDASPRLLMGLRGVSAAVKALPTDPRALIAEAVHDLGVPAAAQEGYFAALLMTVNGWAS